MVSFPKPTHKCTLCIQYFNHGTAESSADLGSEKEVCKFELSNLLESTDRLGEVAF